MLWVKSWSLSEFASLRWWGCEGTCGLRGVEEYKWFYYVGTAGPQSSDHVDTFCDREGLKDCKLSFPAFDIVFLKQKGTKIQDSSQFTWGVTEHWCQADLVQFLLFLETTLRTDSPPPPQAFC